MNIEISILFKDFPNSGKRRGMMELNSEENDFKLYVPSNVKTRLEFFNGFGVSELITTVIVAGIFLPFSFILYKIRGVFLLPVILEFLAVAGTIMMTTKDANNLCVVTQIKFMINFSKIQKKFDYKYYNKFKDEE